MVLNVEVPIFSTPKKVEPSDFIASALPAAGAFVFGEGCEERSKGGFCFLPSFAVNAVVHAHAVNAALDEPGRFQLTQVLADCRLCQTNLIDKVAVDAGVGFNEVPQNADPRRMPQYFRQFSYFVCVGGKQFCTRESHGVFIYRNITMNSDALVLNWAFLTFEPQWVDLRLRCTSAEGE